MKIKLNVETSELIDFLARHECDIALSINDYADLKNLFIAVFDREPSDESR